jgi:hypothetical protein
MTIINTLSKVINVIYLIGLCLFIMDTFSVLEIKSQGLKSLSYYNLLFCTPVLFIWNYVEYKNLSLRILTLVSPILSLIVVLYFGPTKIIFSKSVWLTQSVIYQNCKNSSSKIEFQIQDLGALGYNHRTVEVRYFTCFFILVSKSPNFDETDKKWKKVNIWVNEAKLRDI